MTAFRDLPNAEYEGLRPVLSRPPVGAYMRDLWSRREFIFAVPRNSLRAQNMDTLLGNFWYLLNPALQTSVYFLVFGLLFDANRGIDDYLAYLVIGVLTFSLIGHKHTAARCVANNQSLIRSLHFPRSDPDHEWHWRHLRLSPGVAIMVALARVGQLAVASMADGPDRA